MSINKLAIHGGRPVRSGNWAPWPSATQSDQEAVMTALESGRWSVSGNYLGHKTAEEAFSEAFGEFNNTPHCIPTSSGSSSIIISLVALGIGKGDEVIIPALTWVACATTVMSVGATPVLADVDPVNLCLAPEAIKQNINSKTKAVLLVHLYANIADLVKITAICKQYGIYLIEDCAQAHGATLNEQKVGTFGHFGVFSMHQGKVLTCGEGGACITSDPDLYKKAYKAKSNGRLLNTSNPELGKQQLLEEGQVFSNNYCLSEISSALLTNRLKSLESQNQKRFESRKWLANCLEPYGFSIANEIGNENERATIYHLPLKLPEGLLEKTNTEEFARALTTELSFWINIPYPCLSQNPLLNTIPGASSQLTDLTVSKSVKEEYVLVHHSLLLNPPAELIDLVNAIEKVSIYFNGL